MERKNQLRQGSEKIVCGMCSLFPIWIRESCEQTIRMNQGKWDELGLGGKHACNPTSFPQPP